MNEMYNEFLGCMGAIFLIIVSILVRTFAIWLLGIAFIQSFNIDFNLTFSQCLTLAVITGLINKELKAVIKTSKE